MDRDDILLHVITIDRVFADWGMDLHSTLRSCGQDPRPCCVQTGIQLEALLSRSWTHLEIAGNPQGRVLHHLTQEVSRAMAARGRPIPDRIARRMRDIQQLRNVAAHYRDGERISRNDALESARKLLSVLEWFAVEVFDRDIAPSPADWKAAQLAERQAGRDLGRRSWLPSPGFLLVLGALLAILIFVGWPRIRHLAIQEGEDGRFRLEIDGAALWWPLAQDGWGEALAARGAQPSLGDAQVSWSGRHARIPLSLASTFDPDTLPVPGVWSDTLAERSFEYRFRMRVGVVAYKLDSFDRNEKLFGEILRALQGPEANLPGNVSFIAFDHREGSPAAFAEPGVALRSLDFASMDLISTSAFVALLIRAQTAQEGKGDPYDWLACNLGERGSPYYTSALVAPSDSPIVRFLGDRELSPALFDAFLAQLPEREKLEIYFPSRASTSGYAIPCLSWGQSWENPAAFMTATGKHERTIELLLQPPKSAVAGQIGTLYYELFEDRVREDPTTHIEDLAVLWKDPRVPHGGLIMWNDLLPAKRRAYERGFDSLLARGAAGSFTWPDMGDVHGLTTCSPDNYAALERRLRAHPAIGACVERLAPGASTGPAKSYHAEFQWDEDYRQALAEMLPGEALTFQEMDTKRIPKESFPAAAEAAWSAYTRLRPKAVVLGDNNAVRLLGPRLAHEDVPVVFLGLNGALEDYMPERSPRMTGVLERPQLDRSMEAMVGLLPTPPRQVLVLFDGSETSRSVLEETFGGQTRLELAGATLDLRLLSDWNLWQEAVGTAKEEGYDAILLGLHQVVFDGSEHLDSEAVLRWTSEKTKLPLFAMWDFSVGPEGALGGYVVSGTEQGRAAGRMVGRILAGEAPSQIPVVDLADGELRFSARQLERFGLRLPPEMELRSKLVH